MAMPIRPQPPKGGGEGCLASERALVLPRPSPYRSPSADRTRGRIAPSFCHPPVSPTRPMSQIQPRTSSSSSSSSFQSVLNAALEEYEKKTKTKLLAHPLAAQLQSCDSSAAILSVLQNIIQQFDRRRSSDERLSNWLGPTVNVLYAFSSTLGQGVGLVCLS